MTFIVYGYNDRRIKNDSIEDVHSVKAEVIAEVTTGHECYHGCKFGEELQVVQYDNDFALVRSSIIPNAPYSAEFPLWLGCESKAELATLLRQLADKLED